MGSSVIFDMDGVLLDSERIVIDCWSAVAGRNGISGIVPVLYKCIGTTSSVTDRIMSDFLGGDAAYSELKNQYRQEYKNYVGRNGIPVKRGARELLGRLSRRGIPTGLASSTRSDIVRRQLSDAGLLEFFDAVAGGEMAPRSKPEPDLFLLCASMLGCPPEDAFVIEDSFNGVRAGHAAGMRVIMVPDLIGPDSGITPLLFRLCGDLFQVLELLEALI